MKNGKQVVCFGIGAAILAVLLMIFFWGRDGNYVESGCEVSSDYGSAVKLSVPSGEYNLLVRSSSTTDDVIPVVMSASGQCESIDIPPGTTNWSHLSELSLQSGQLVTIYQELGGANEYGHTEVLLQPIESPVRCIGDHTCRYRDDDRMIDIVPARNFSLDFSISASVLVSPSGDRLAHVDRYDQTGNIKVDQQSDYREGEAGVQIGYYRSGQTGIYRHSDSSVVTDITQSTNWLWLLGVVPALIGLAVVIWFMVHRVSARREHDRFMGHRELYLTDEKWHDERHDRIKRYAIVTGVIAVAVMVMLVIVRAYIFDITRIDGDSMEPNASDGQIRIVHRWPVTLHDIIESGPLAKRGQAVYIDQEYLSQQATTHRGLLFKRVIAIGGDTVEFDSGGVRVRDFTGELIQLSDQDTVMMDMSYGSFTVDIPAGHVFVMGDNRPSSIDSRTIGVVPERAVIGFDQ